MLSRAVAFLLIPSYPEAIDPRSAALNNEHFCSIPSSPLCVCVCHDILRPVLKLARTKEPTSPATIPERSRQKPEPRVQHHERSSHCATASHARLPPPKQNRRQYALLNLTRTQHIQSLGGLVQRRSYLTLRHGLAQRGGALPPLASPLILTASLARAPSQASSFSLVSKLWGKKEKRKELFHRSKPWRKTHAE